MLVTKRKGNVHEDDIAQNLTGCDDYYLIFYMQLGGFTHWGRMTHICITKLGYHWFRCSDNGLSIPWIGSLIHIKIIVVWCLFGKASSPPNAQHEKPHKVSGGSWYALCTERLSHRLPCHQPAWLPTRYWHCFLNACLILWYRPSVWWHFMSSFLLLLFRCNHLNQELYLCQLCRYWWHRRLWKQAPVPPVNDKFDLTWQSFLCPCLWGEWPTHEPSVCSDTEQRHRYDCSIISWSLT